MLDGISIGGSRDAASSDILQTLGQLAQGVVQSVAQNAAGALVGRVEGAINNAPRTQNTAPVPDITASAANPAASFVNAKPFGVSLPVLLIGVGALAFLLSPRLAR